MTDFPLNLKDIKHLLRSDIFDELFLESIPSKENQSRLDNNNTNIVNGLEDGGTFQTANAPSTHVIPNEQVLNSYSVFR